MKTVEAEPELVQAVLARLSYVCRVCSCGKTTAKCIGRAGPLLQAVADGSNGIHVVRDS
jgi:hypothetical protein